MKVAFNMYASTSLTVVGGSEASRASESPGKVRKVVSVDATPSVEEVESGMVLPLEPHVMYVRCLVIAFSIYFLWYRFGREDSW